MSVPVASATHSKRCAALTADTWLPSLVINVQNLNLHIFDFCQILHIGFFEQLHSSLLRLCLLTWRTFHAHRSFFRWAYEPDCESRLAILIKSQESCWATRFFFLVRLIIGETKPTQSHYKICMLFDVANLPRPLKKGYGASSLSCCARTARGFRAAFIPPLGLEPRSFG